MRALTNQLVEAKALSSLQAGLAQLVEEQHLYAWSADTLARSRFVGEAATGFAKLPETQVVVLRGAAITDLYSFCAQLELGLGVDRLRRRIHGPRGVHDALQHQPIATNGKPIKYRFVIWDDAHTLLKNDPALFGQLADALAGVSAKLEFSTTGPLLLQRAIFVGTAALDLYAEDPRGQFARWFTLPEAKSPWPRLTGRKRPTVGRFSIPLEL